MKQALLVKSHIICSSNNTDKKSQKMERMKPSPTRYMTVIAKELFKSNIKDKLNTKNEKSFDTYKSPEKKLKLDAPIIKAKPEDPIVQLKSESDLPTCTNSSQSSSGPVSPKSVDLEVVYMPLQTLSKATITTPEPQRCQYWPRCARGETCRFIHPIEVCKKYPHCPKPSNKCLFIHPGEIITACKFGTHCTNKNCRFAHQDKEGQYYSDKGLKRKISEDGGMENIKSSIPVRCRNGLFCTNTGCAFLHPGHEPVSCKYGAHCNRLDCYFIHPNPSFDKFGRAISNRDLPISRNPKKYHRYLRKCVSIYIEQIETELKNLDVSDTEEEEEFDVLLKK